MRAHDNVTPTASAATPVDGENTAAGDSGPYGVDELEISREDAAQGRLDIGSVLVPIPEGTQIQVEMDPGGQPQAVHLVTGQGRVTIAAYAAPKSPGQWREVAAEIADALRNDGAPVAVEAGPWGREVAASTPNGDIRFIGVDGYRWMIRAVASGPAGAADSGSALTTLTRSLVEQTVVDRGSDPYPVRAALPIVLPAAMIEQMHAAAAAQQEQQLAASAQAQDAAQAQGTSEQAPAPTENPRRGPAGSAMQQLG